MIINNLETSYHNVEQSDLHCPVKEKNIHLEV